MELDEHLAMSLAGLRPIAAWQIWRLCWDYLEVAEGVKRPHVIGWYQVRITRCHRACDWMWAVMLGGGVVALDRGRLLRSCWPSRTARNWTASYFTAQFTTPAS